MILRFFYGVFTGFVGIALIVSAFDPRSAHVMHFGSLFGGLVLLLNGVVTVVEVIEAVS